jgi:hypothetical protein
MKKKELERNDLDGARLFYEQNKPITSSQAETLLMMQDDQAKLLSVMKKENWRIVRDAARPINLAQKFMSGLQTTEEDDG